MIGDVYFIASDIIYGPIRLFGRRRKPTVLSAMKKAISVKANWPGVVGAEGGPLRDTMRMALPACMITHACLAAAELWRWNF